MRERRDAVGATWVGRWVRPTEATEYAGCGEVDAIGDGRRVASVVACDDDYVAAAACAEVDALIVVVAGVVVGTVVVGGDGTRRMRVGWAAATEMTERDWSVWPTDWARSH